MDVFHSLVVARLIFILGIVNLTMGLLIIVSCRCLPGFKVSNFKVGATLMRYSAFKKLFGLHCYLWAIFWPSVIVHAFLALMFFGWPS